MTDDKRAIRQLVDDWMDWTREGDFGRVLDLMTDDVIFMAPGRAPFGKEEFRAHSAESRGVSIDGTNEIEELSVHGDWAWMRSAIAITVTPPEGNAVQRSGHTLTIFRKCDDGRWRLFRDANLVT